MNQALPGTVEIQFLSKPSGLSDTSHRIRFVYTPKHSSWLNQIEIWFSILVRRLLSRLSCLSVQELRTRILAFIAYYNRTSNEAFHWTYKEPRPWWSVQNDSDRIESMS